MRRRIDYRIFYKCDPWKNEECRKTGCGEVGMCVDPYCGLTSNPAYSADGVKYRVVFDECGDKVRFVVERVED